MLQAVHSKTRLDTTQITRSFLVSKAFRRRLTVDRIAPGCHGGASVPAFKLLMTKRKQRSCGRAGRPILPSVAVPLAFFGSGVTASSKFLFGTVSPARQGQM